MSQKFLLPLCLLICLSTADAAADDAPRWGVLLPAISLTSDHRFNGMSLSNRRPALQGSLHLWRPDGYYAGLWLSQVDFLDGHTTLELDSYLGRNWTRGQYETKFELMYTAFNDEEAPGPTYDFLQLKFGVKRTWSRATLGGYALYSPSGSAGVGRVGQLRSEASLKLLGRLKAVAVFGRWWSEDGIDRSFWDAGLTLEWRTIDLDLRYSGTNLARSQCFYTNWCEPGLYAKLTLASYR
ncbi:MAG: TorF family putative porin [Pseudomonadota bacterium]